MTRNMSTSVSTNYVDIRPTVTTTARVKTKVTNMERIEIFTPPRPEAAA